MKKDETMSTHAKLSPSARYRWSKCPGSVRESAKYPDSSGPAAIDGTHSHYLLETCIKNNLCDPTTLVGQTLTDHEGSFVVDIARALRVKVAIDWLIAENFDSVISETKVNPEHLLGRSDMSGTVDISCLKEGVLTIVDYKDGMGIVNAKDNPQLEQYAMGILSGFKLPINVPYPVHEIRMVIIQPKLTSRGLPAISQFTRKTEEILGMIPTMVAEANAASQPDAPLVSGDHCKFCAARGACSARSNQVMKEISVMFQPVEAQATVPATADELVFQVAEKNPHTMSDKQLVEIMEAAPMVKKLLEDVSEELMRRMKDERKPIAGMKLVNGRGSKAWALPDDEIASKLIKMGAPKAEVYVTKLVTPAAATKLAWQKKDGTVVQFTKRQIETIEKEYITKLAGTLTVVPESDPRTAVVLDVAPMFGAIPQAAPALPAWLR